MPLTQQEQTAISELLKIIGASKLISGLEDLAGMPLADHYVHIQKGASDGNKVSIEKLRGFAGDYNATTNTPVLANSSGVEGTKYRVSVAGNRDFGSGILSLSENDIIEFEAGKWSKKVKISGGATVTQIIALGDIGSDDIAAGFNAFTFENPVEVQPTSSGLTQITATQNSQFSKWLFLGDSGTYDGSNPDDSVELSDFIADVAVSIDTSGLQVIDAPTGTPQEAVESIDAALLKARGTEIFGAVSVNINVGDSTAFDVGAIVGQIKSDAGYFPIDYAGETGIAVSNIAANSTYVYLDTNGTIQQQNTVPTSEEFRQKLFIARFASNGTNLIAFEYLYNPSGQYTNSLRDVYEYIQSSGVPLRKGFTITPNANLTFSRATGTILELGGNGNSLSPNIKTLNAVDPATIFILTQNSAFGSPGNNVPVDSYDVDGTITALTNNRFAAHRVYLFSSGNHTIQYGQAQYVSLDEARANALNEDYVINPGNLNGEFLGWWVVQESTTDLSDANTAKFFPYSIGGQSGASIAGALLSSNNLSDVLDPPLARTNIGARALYDTRNTEDITGTHTIDWNIDQHILNPTGDVVLSDSNLPSDPDTKVISGVFLASANAVTLASGWEPRDENNDPLSDTLDTAFVAEIVSNTPLRILFTLNNIPA